MWASETSARVVRFWWKMALFFSSRWLFCCPPPPLRSSITRRPESATSSDSIDLSEVSDESESYCSTSRSSSDRWGLPFSRLARLPLLFDALEGVGETDALETAEMTELAGQVGMAVVVMVMMGFGMRRLFGNRPSCCIYLKMAECWILVTADDDEDDDNDDDDDWTASSDGFFAESSTDAGDLQLRFRACSSLWEGAGEELLL